MKGGRGESPEPLSGRGRLLRSSAAAWSMILLLTASAFAGTLTGSVTLPNTSLPLKSGTFTFSLSQSAYVPSSFLVVPLSVNCYTDSQQGNVVGLPDPLIAPVVTPDTTTGSLAGGTYYVVYAYRDASNNRTFYSPESTVLLSGAGKLTVNPPALQPSGTTWDIFIGTSSGGETAQATGQSYVNFVQSTPLSAGAALPASNATVCSLRFTDELIPSGTWYNTNLVAANGSQIPGFPQRWQMYGGANATINLSNGFPIAQNITIFPTPIYANPPSGTQSITGTLNLQNATVTGLSLTNPKLTGVIQSTGGVPMGITLKSGPTNYTTTSTAFVDVDAVNLSYTVTVPVGWKLKVDSLNFVTATVAAGFIAEQIVDNGVSVYGAQISMNSVGAAQFTALPLMWLINGDGASHTVKLQWHSSTGSTGNLSNSVMIFTLMPSN